MAQAEEWTDQPEQDARPEDQAEQNGRDYETYCDARWDKLLELRSTTDDLVLQMIANANGDPCFQYLHA